VGPILLECVRPKERAPEVWAALQRQVPHGHLDFLPGADGGSECLEPLAGTGQRPDLWHLCLYLRVVHAGEHSLQLELLGAPEVVAAVPHRRRLAARRSPGPRSP